MFKGDTLASRQSTPVASSDWSAASRALAIQKCMGVVDRDVSLAEHARDLRDMEARTGIDVETIQMAARIAEEK